MAHLNLSWFHSIKRDACQRIAPTTLVLGCKRGDKNYIRALMVIYWKFVDEFPEILYEQFSTMSDPVIKRQAKYLSGITADEKSHRHMWLETSDFLGLSYQTLNNYRERFPLVNKISLRLRDTVDTALTLLRIVGVEIVAEILSSELLSSDKFCNALNEKARVWFKVHVAHTGTTHEQIALRLALKELEHEVNLQEVVMCEVLAIVDMFVDAAASAPEIAEEFAKAA